MLTTSGNNFYGDIRSHERVELTFGAYLDYTQDLYDKLTAQFGVEHLSNCEILKYGQECNELERNRLYLAQVPMFSKDKETPPLRALMEDIAMPSFLNPSSVANVNLWMTAHESKSSTHYDPYHNILCVVVGQKKVTLWPPNAAPYLYPHPVYGEASNHSSVDFVNPDERKHPLFKHAMETCQVVILQAGDALFIPEGWYHQVDSKCFTIAVNVWWPSVVALALDSHMSGYYLRRTISSLLDFEKQKVFQKVNSQKLLPEVDKTWDGINHPPHKLSVQPKVEAEVKKHLNEVSEDTEHTKFDKTGRVQAFKGLSPLQKQCLYSLLQTCNSEMKVEHLARPSKTVEEIEEFSPHRAESPFLLDEKDIGVQVFSNLDPLALRQVLLVMVHHFPRTLEVFICRKLSPIAAEVLTRKFDEMDSVVPDIEQRNFYKAFYGVFEDPKVPMSALLDGKEAFAAQALYWLLDAYLGLSLGPATQCQVDGGRSSREENIFCDGCP